MRYSLKYMLSQAKLEGYAVGAFNIFNYVSAQSIIKAAEEINSPLILQTSVSTVKQIGVSSLIYMLNGLIQKSEAPVVIHLDHCTDINLAKQCIDAGWDSVMIDASAKSFNENVRISKEIKDYAKKRNIYVEGELGVIKGVEDNILSETYERTKYTDAIKYLNSTKVDAFAPAVGTVHGPYKGEVSLDFDLVKKLSNYTDCPVVIHGGSGLSPVDFTDLIKCGATKINISTAIKQAYFSAIKDYLKFACSTLNPLKLRECIKEEIKKTAIDHMKLFGSCNKSKIYK